MVASLGLLAACAAACAAAGVGLWRQGRFVREVPPERPLERTRDGSVETVYFESEGTRIEAWLFQPPAPTDLVVIMAPGLTSTKDCLLEPFAWAFVRSGAAVLLFDFRTLGGSDGLPRHWVDPLRQVVDYEAALAFARQRFARVVAWGSSFSGGQALCLAARHPSSIHAVIAQAPYLAPARELEPHGWALCRFVALAVLDLLLSRLSRGRLPPVYITTFGKPGEHVFAPSDECPSRYAEDWGTAGPFWRALPARIRGGWRNVMCARSLASLDRFTPMQSLGDIRCPVLMVGGERDTLVPVRHLREASSRLSDARLCLLECAHFDLYLDPVRANNLERQCELILELSRAPAPRASVAAP